MKTMLRNDIFLKANNQIREILKSRYSHVIYKQEFHRKTKIDMQNTYKKVYNWTHCRDENQNRER